MIGVKIENVTYKQFIQLPVYQKCREFRLKVAMLVNSHFPDKEKYRLSDQLIRSSRSITANIAEGFGRYHHLENIHFCRNSRGSLEESREHLITAKDENYISAEKLEELEDCYRECLKQLNGYIFYLKKAKGLIEY